MLSGLSSVACGSSGGGIPRHGAVPHRRLLKRSAAMALQRCWSRFLRSRTVEISRTSRPQRPKQSQSTGLQQEECTAPRTGVDNAPPRGLWSFSSTIERIGSNKISQSEVDWVIGLAGQPVGQPDPKNPTALRGPVGVWNCESRIASRGCGGTCFHAVDSLARVRG